MKIRHTINYSFNDALKVMVMGTSPEALVKARERVWVKTLATQLEDELGGDDVRVFTAYNRDNVEDYGADQLLNDIQVCRISKTTTADKKKEEILYVHASLWQVEIDLSRDLPHAVYAFNRLVIGNSENKLFVGAQMVSHETYINTLIAPAQACSGRVHLALIPHPEDWDDDEHPINVWQLVDGKWEEAP